MPEIIITTLSQYLGVVSNVSILYRGVEDKTFGLIPSVARKVKYDLKYLVQMEEAMLKQFKKRSIPNLDYYPSNDWEWLMLAQHHGLPTRLLDWTSNPCVALFFACKNDKVDGMVYRYMGTNFLDPVAEPHPFQIEHDYTIAVPYMSARIAPQAAYFTVNHDPLEPLAIDSFLANQQIFIKADAKKEILSQLRMIGISEESLFPGLDGLCKEIKLEVSSALGEIN